MVSGVSGMKAVVILFQVVEVLEERQKSAERKKRSLARARGVLETLSQEFAEAQAEASMAEAKAERESQVGPVSSTVKSLPAAFG